MIYNCTVCFKNVSAQPLHNLMNIDVPTVNIKPIPITRKCAGIVLSLRGDKGPKRGLVMNLNHKSDDLLTGKTIYIRYIAFYSLIISVVFIELCSKNVKPM